MITQDDIKDGGDVFVRLAHDTGGGSLGYVLDVFPTLNLALVVGLFPNATPLMFRFEDLRIAEPPK